MFGFAAVFLSAIFTSLPPRLLRDLVRKISEPILCHCVYTRSFIQAGSCPPSS
jgi:hypothetical protein